MIHFQKSFPGWFEAITHLPDGALFKVVDQGQEFAAVKAYNPNIYTCLRHWYDHGQVFGGTYNENKQRARDFFETFIDGTFISQIAPYCDFVEEWNEYLANSQSALEIADRVMWAEAVVAVWNNEYRTQPELAHIRLVLCNTAVGNSIAEGFFETARDYNCLIGYHPYSLWQRGIRNSADWASLSGLWVGMEQRHGIKVDWLFTEAGPFESAVDGWRSPNCLGANRDKYVQSVRLWIRDVQQTVAYREGRIFGFALYTTGRAGTVWKHFWTEQPELNMLADMIREEWKPGVYVPPPPPPTDEGRGKPRVQYKRVYHRVSVDATDEQYLDICLKARQTQGTVGGSVDDAMVADLDSRTMIEYGDQYGEAELNQFRDSYYPGVNIIYKPLPQFENPNSDSENSSSDEANSDYRIIDVVDQLPKHTSKTYRTRALSAITSLTIHHTVSPVDRSIASIASFHVSTKGYPRIAYHYVINDLGEIRQTNYLETKSYHAGTLNAPGDENLWSVGIALQGTFTDAPPPQAQLDATRWLVAELKSDLDIEDVWGHRQMPGAQTQCPGNTWEDWLPYVAGG